MTDVLDIEAEENIVSIKAVEFRGMERPEVLTGVTYKTKVPNGNGDEVKLFITINEHEGKPFEIFLRTKDAEIAGRIDSITLSVTRQLRNDIPTADIIKDLKSAWCIKTEHHIPRSNGEYAASIEARIGYILEKHINTGMSQLEKDINSQVIILKKEPH